MGVRDGGRVHGPATGEAVTAAFTAHPAPGRRARGLGALVVSPGVLALPLPPWSHPPRTAGETAALPAVGWWAAASQRRCPPRGAHALVG